MFPYVTPKPRFDLSLPALVLVGFLYPGHASAINNPTQLVHADAGAGDMFGYAVSVSGTTALVGARLDDTGAGMNAGSAYIFDTAQGTQRFKLTAHDAEPGDLFGRSVAVGGSVAVIGAPLNDDAGNDSGSAYVFDAATGQQRFKLTAGDASATDQFGHTVAVSGDTAIIAAPWEDQAKANAGAVYVFNTAGGTQQRKLTAPDAGAGDLFGLSLAIDGGLALIGAMSDGGGTDSGSAYLFNTTTGALLRELTANDAAPGDKFGQVALSGDIALIGAPGSDTAAADAGAAYLFDATTGSQLFKLTAPDGVTGDRFGFSVALDGNLALVGAYGADGDTGAVYGFDVLTGNQLFRYTPAAALPGESFGFSLALSGLNAVAGAPLADAGGDNAGLAYAFALPPPPPPIIGDLNHDGFVGVEDLSFLLLHWNEYAGYRQPQLADITGDGFVGLDDLNFLLARWNQGTPPPLSGLAVPEPTTIVVYVLGAALACRRTGRTRSQPRS